MVIQYLFTIYALILLGELLKQRGRPISVSPLWLKRFPWISRWPWDG